MNKLFNKRRSQHFLLLLRYWRLVFNDHFVIALFILFGALAYGYSQLLPQLSPNQWWTRWVLVIWFTLIPQLGRLATLIKRPDPVFLLPQVSAIRHYLSSAKLYSLILGEIITVVGTFIALPFALTTEKLGTGAIVAIFLTAVVTKADWLHLTHKAISQRWGHQHRRTVLEYWANPLLAALATWLINPFVGLGVAVLLYIAVCYYYRDLDLDWRLAVQSEQDRMYSVYRFFNLFTDVPSVQGKTRRRHWADGVVNWLSIPNHPWSYLYARAFVRSTEVSGIIGRLTVLGMVIVFLLPAGWLNTVIVALFIYLIATQLMPLYDQYQANVFTHIYPVASGQQQEDFKQLLTKVTAVEAFLVALASVGWQLNWSQLLLNLVIAIIEVAILTRFYFSVRVKKLVKWGFIDYACKT